MRITQRISIFVTGVAICALLASVGIAVAGSLDSPGAPGVTSSYTLEDIYSRLNLGTAGIPGTFAEPAAGPTAGTMHTLNDIMGKAPVVDASGATAGDVLAGKTFWGLASGGWGPRTGSLATRTVSNATVSQAAGYYSAFNLSTVDTNLATANIKSGVSIFGVSGTSTVVDTAGATAVPGDMLTTKTAYVGGSLVTGTVAAGSNVNGGQGLKTFTIPDGMYSGSKTATASDTNLATANIKSGASIFGVAGKSTVVDTASVTPATNGDIISGKTAYVNGSQVTGTVTAGVDVTGANGSKAITIPDGLYSSSKTATASDTNLVAGNIKYGASIFGVTGNLAGGVPSTCPGGSSPSGRWCDNNNGTVTDTTNGLVWLKDAGWGGIKPWRSATDYDDAHTRAGTLSSGTAGLTDGSVEGDWRLPTKTELVKLATGTEPIRSGSPQLFTGVQSYYYWSSTTNAVITGYAWFVNLSNGFVTTDNKMSTFYVWPVRGGQ